jgi:hypothetical protein
LLALLMFEDDMLSGETWCCRGDYLLLAVQRCGNEAGSRTRCRAHYTAAFTLLDACAPPQAAAAPAAAAAAGQAEGRREQPQLTVLAKVDSNAKLAQLLGLQDVTLQDKETAESLGDASEWSPSTADGKAAKLPQAKAKDAASEAAAAAAALAAAGLPRSLAAVLAKTAAEDGLQLSSRAWPAGTALHSKGRQQQQQQQQQQDGQAMHAAAGAATSAVAAINVNAAAEAAPAAVDATADACMACDSAVPEAAPFVLPDALPGSNTDAEISPTPASCSMPGGAAAHTSSPGDTAVAAIPAAAGAQVTTQAASQRLGVGQVTTATELEVATAAHTPAQSPAVAPGFATSAPAHLARLAAAFKPQ